MKRFLYWPPCLVVLAGVVAAVFAVTGLLLASCGGETKYYQTCRYVTMPPGTSPSTVQICTSPSPINFPGG